MSDLVYSVHTTRPDDSGAVEIVFISEREKLYPTDEHACASRRAD